MDIAGVLKTIGGLLNSVIPLLVGIGAVYFIWGVVQYVIAGGEEAKKKGKDVIIYGIIGLAIIVSFWGLVNVILNTFDLNNTQAPTTQTITGCDIGSVKDFAGLANYVACNINNSVIPFLFAVALAIFVWGVVNFFILHPADEAKRNQGKQFIVWGIVALTVMLSVWGLVAILGRTFNINTSVIPKTAEKE